MPIALLDRPLRWLVPVLCGVLLNGCASLDYYAQVSRGQLDLLAAIYLDAGRNQPRNDVHSPDSWHREPPRRLGQ